MWTYLKALPRFFLWSYAFFFGVLVSFSQRWVSFLLRTKKDSQYVLRGACQKTGMCCRSLAIEIPHSWGRRAWLVKAVRIWYREVFNFHSLGMLYGNWLVFECHHLRPDHTCGIYPYRPSLCREFPLTPLWGHGQLHKGCGFWFVKREDLGTFQEKLSEFEHEHERREYLRKGADTVLKEYRDVLAMDSKV